PPRPAPRGRPRRVLATRTAVVLPARDTRPGLPVAVGLGAGEPDPRVGRPSRGGLTVGVGPRDLARRGLSSRSLQRFWNRWGSSWSPSTVGSEGESPRVALRFGTVSARQTGILHWRRALSEPFATAARSRLTAGRAASNPEPPAR